MEKYVLSLPAERPSNNVPWLDRHHAPCRQVWDIGFTQDGLRLGIAQASLALLSACTIIGSQPFLWLERILAFIHHDPCRQVWNIGSQPFLWLVFQWRSFTTTHAVRYGTLVLCPFLMVFVSICITRTVSCFIYRKHVLENMTLLALPCACYREISTNLLENYFVNQRTIRTFATYSSIAE